MDLNQIEQTAIGKIKQLSREADIDITGAKIRRSSSRFCLGVEHGDYNGTELFGVGTDRFIWLGYKPNNTNKVKIFSANFPDDGVVEFELNNVPEPLTVKDSWARFPYGVDYILNRECFKLTKGFDAVVYGNIPGGGMSRSASLSLNLILTMLEVNDITLDDKLKIVDLAQAVENDYIGSPCGKLDPIMILFAKKDMGTHYNPKTSSINYIPLGADHTDFRIVVMDTGTVRLGLEKSTYKVRRNECEQFVAMLKAAGCEIASLADVDEKRYDEITARFGVGYPDLCKRMDYIYNAQKRFYQMILV